MKKALIINTHHPYESSPGRLNAAVAAAMERSLLEKGWQVKTTRVADGFQAGEEADKHLWADVVILQGPVNWMVFPWSFKKYPDEV